MAANWDATASAAAAAIFCLLTLQRRVSRARGGNMTRLTPKRRTAGRRGLKPNCTASASRSKRCCKPAGLQNAAMTGSDGQSDQLADATHGLSCCHSRSRRPRPAEGRSKRSNQGGLMNDQET